MQKPEMNLLEGKVVLNTRPATQSVELSRALNSFGAISYPFPLLSVWPHVSPEELSQSLVWLGDNGLVLFTSANGAKIAAELSSLRPKAGVIGESTAQSAQQHGFDVEFIAAKATAEEFAKELITHYVGAAQRRFLLLQAATASSELAGRLTDAGFELRKVALYDAGLPVETKNQAVELMEVLKRDLIDVVILTSSNSCRVLVELVTDQQALEKLLSLPVAVIGPKTAQTAREVGFVRVITALQASEMGLIGAIEESFK